MTGDAYLVYGERRIAQLVNILLIVYLFQRFRAFASQRLVRVIFTRFHHVIFIKASLCDPFLQISYQLHILAAFLKKHKFITLIKFYDFVVVAAL